MSRTVCSPICLKLAEKLTILNERGNGVLIRLNYIKKRGSLYIHIKFRTKAVSS
uniref:Uncharacterized protein n=1 Tax=Fundulus heteroclitus TaxID=8078 RepID=A0A3Q2QX67_FUNHE